MRISCGDKLADVRLERESALVDGRRVAFRASRHQGKLEAIRIGQEVFRVRAAREGEHVFLWCAGEVRGFRLAAGRAAHRTEAAGGLLAPMPGRVRKVASAPGATVSRGDLILILEAMKMEHAIRAPRDGTVAKILHHEGDLVEAGATLAEII